MIHNFNNRHTNRNDQNHYLSVIIHPMGCHFTCSISAAGWPGTLSAAAPWEDVSALRSTIYCQWDGVPALCLHMAIQVTNM
jgi:hypothetical protein